MLFTKNFNAAILSSVVTGACLISSASTQTLAQNSNSNSNFDSSSSEETQITRGVGFRQTNKFNFKYKERIKTYEDQIQMGLNRGWLGTQDAETFNARLSKLKEMEAKVSANGYPKAELDTLEQQITKFNKEFSDAGQKKTTIITPHSAPKIAPGPNTQPKATIKTTPKSTTRTTAKTNSKTNSKKTAANSTKAK